MTLMTRKKLLFYLELKFMNANLLRLNKLWLILQDRNNLPNSNITPTRFAKPPQIPALRN